MATGQWHKSRVNSAAFVSKSEIASAGVDRSLIVWDFKDAETDQGTLKPKVRIGLSVHIAVAQMAVVRSQHVLLDALISVLRACGNTAIHEHS